MMTTMLSACGGKTETDDTSDTPDGRTEAAATSFVLENAYIATDIPMESQNQGYMDVVVANGGIYYMTNEQITETIDDGSTDDTTPDDGGTSVNSTSAFSAATTTTTTTTMTTYENITGYITRIISLGDDGKETAIWEKEFTYPVYNEQREPVVGEEEEFIVYENIYAFSIDAGGNLWIFMNTERYSQNYNVSESKMMLTKYAPDGTMLASSDISDITSAGEYFYPSNVCFSGTGDLCTMSYDAIYVFDGETAEFDFKITEQGYMNGMTTTNTGDVIYMMRPQMEYEIKAVDFEAKKAGPAMLYSGNIYFNTVAAGSGDYSFYTVQNDYIYGFKLDTMTADVIVNFTNSDVDSSYISRISSMSNGDFVVASHDWGRRGSSMVSNGTTIIRLSPNPNPLVEGKVLLTIGAVYVDSATRSAIRQFNSSSSTARITVLDYSQYETTDNYNAGMVQLDMDILAGKAPDIICFQGLQPAKYSSKGILEDMQPYIEADASINVDDLFGNILEAGMYDGKLYRIITAYSISTLVGKTSIVGEAGSFTAAKVNEMAARFPDAEIVMTTEASNWLSSCISMALDEYIDWSTGRCSFNTPEFIDLLNSARHFPATIDYNKIYEDYQLYEQNMKTAYKDDRALLQNSGLNQIREIRSTLELFGEDISFVGYPTQSGGGALIYPQQDYGISAASKNKDEAWSFISMFLNGEVDGTDMWSQSISRKAFELEATEEMIPLKERDFSKGVEIVEFFPGGGMSTWSVNSINEINLADYPNYELTQKEVDTARSVIESAKRVYASDETISTILFEEIDAFLGGARSAEEVANVIQSRVSIYVSESM